MLPFQPSDNDFRLLTLTPLRKSISTALSHQVWGNLLQQPQEGNGSPQLHTLASRLLLLSL